VVKSFNVVMNPSFLLSVNYAACPFRLVQDSGRAVLCSLFIKDRGTNPEKDKRTVKLDGDANVDVVVEMFHTQYMGLMQTTLRSSEVFLCVYSKYDRTSFAEIAQHLPIMREANEKAKVIVVATDHLESEGRKVEVEKIGTPTRPSAYLLKRLLQWGSSSQSRTARGSTRCPSRTRRPLMTSLCRL